MSESSLAYSLSQMGEGWRWSVYDEDGVTVADGSHASRDVAEAAVKATLRCAPTQRVAGIDQIHSAQL